MLRSHKILLEDRPNFRRRNDDGTEPVESIQAVLYGWDCRDEELWDAIIREANVRPGRYVHHFLTYDFEPGDDFVVGLLKVFLNLILET
jgi:hypothetical protein